MAVIKFINYEGKEHEVELENGKSLMQLAMDSPNNEELQMLEMTPEKQANSRLSCQIKVTDAMDGMEVHVPEFQM